MCQDGSRASAVLENAAKGLEPSKMPLIPADENPNMVLHVLRYDLEYRNSAAIDPLTAILSLTDEEKSDPRIESAIEEILEDCFHD